MNSPNPVENTAPIQRGRPFEPGQSGNPKGRPKGARNNATILAEALLDGEANAITRKLIETPLRGDTTALRLCLDRESDTVWQRRPAPNRNSYRDPEFFGYRLPVQETSGN
jgi:hypothetical protein